MSDRIAILLGWALLAGAIVVGSFFVAHGIRDRGKNNVITVTGSAKKRIVSDYVVWDAYVTSQQASAATAAEELASWTRKIRSFFDREGVLADELTVQPISTDTVTKGSSAQVVGYRLTRSFEVRSSRVTAIATVAEDSSELLGQGIVFAAQAPQYVFTKLSALRPELLTLAAKDAQNRGRVLVETTGGHLGPLRGVDVGVFQVTSPNSTDVSDYGVYDTSTLQKDVTAVVNVTFALD